MLALFSDDECKREAAAADRARKTTKASTTEEYRQIAALREALCAAMEKNGVAIVAASGGD